MKKVLLMLGVMLFSASAFAMNQEAMDDKTCAEQRASFEEIVNSLNQDSFIAQYIVTNLADTFRELPDEQAMPLAQCYDTYRVKGEAMTQFVRTHSDIFRQKALESNKGDEAKQAVISEAKVYDELQTEMLDFAHRVEFLSEQAKLDHIVALGQESYVVQYILSNMVDPMKKMTDQQAAPKAKAYAALKVNGLALTEFVRAHSNDYSMYVEIEMENFADRVEKLAK